MPWCARCGTGISQHEIVTEGYQELTHTSIFLRFPLRNRPGEDLLVWTTTPWTLTSNVAAAVHPDLPYVLVENQGRRFWLSKGALDNALRGAYTVLDEKTGYELEGWSYDGPFDELEAEQQIGGRTDLKALVRIPIVARDDQGRAVGPETVEFRLPDGSAHPHLLLAGIAQSMLAGRGVVSDDLLARTAVGESDDASPPVPRSFAEVAEGLRQRRGVLEAGGVFPPHVIDRFLQVLDPNA